MKAVVALVVVGALIPAVAAERSWELRAEFQAIKPGDPEVAVLRFPDGTSIEVPIAALSPASQDAVRRATTQSRPDQGTTDTGDPSVVTVRGPFGRPVRVAVPESIKDVECDAIHCRSAAEAADVYRLALANAGLTAEQHAAAEARLGEWEAMSEKGLVRLGDRWVTCAESRAAADEAAKVFGHALELMRQGNAELAEEDLRSASRIDPENARPSFVLGLAYSIVAKNPVKAVEHLADVVRREPDNAAALVDLAVSEVLAHRYATAVEHFRAAAEIATDPRPVVDNVAWAVRLAGDAKTNPAQAKNRMPEKLVADLNSLYRSLTQDRKIKPAEAVSGPRFVGPDGVPCTVTTLADVAKLFDDAAGRSSSARQALGFVVARGRVVCPRQVLVNADGTLRETVTIVPPGAPEHRMVARLVTAPEDSEVALLACEDLKIEPLPLASEMPSPPEVFAVDRAGEAGSEGALRVARGRILAPAKGEEEGHPRLVHAAVVSRGVGGGPMLDPAGRVVGMVAATPRTDASGNTAGFGVPAERILEVVSEHCDELPTSEADGTAVAGIERRATDGTVFVVVSGDGSTITPRPEGPGR